MADLTEFRKRSKFDLVVELLSLRKENERLHANVVLAHKLFKGAILPEDGDQEGNQWLNDAAAIVRRNGALT